MTTRILLLEDRAEDAELITRAVQAALPECDVRRVEGRTAFEGALHSAPAPDLILSDHNVPSFTGRQALEITQRLAPQTPFILVTGSLDEETAVEYMKSGAADYVLKDRLARLGPAVVAALERHRTRRELEHQLRQAQKMEAIGRLAAGVAHDFNNILTAISGYAELLLEDLPSGDPRRPDVEEIRKAGQRATALTRQLLAFSRQQVLEPRVLDLNAVLGDLEPMVRRLLGERVTLRTTRAADLGRIRADPSQLEQVILNLALNAGDAMPEGGTLTVETANVDLDATYARQHFPVVPGPYVMLAVTDSGIGMDQDTQARIFEPFFTTKEKGKGTGLGLATVYGIVKQSGGFIWVYSEPGHGASFKVYLPRVDEPPTPPDRSSQEPARLQGTETILLVEDEESVRLLARQVLERAGYQVITVSGGEEALQMAARHQGPIHLVLTDVIMRGMSGDQLAARLGGPRPGHRVLYMSGYADDAIVNHGMLAPGVAYLQKPFTPEALLRAVRRALERA